MILWLRADTEEDGCSRSGCEAFSGHADYCFVRELRGFFPSGVETGHSREVTDACHFCHERKAIVQFENERGFCKGCVLHRMLVFRRMIPSNAVSHAMQTFDLLHQKINTHFLLSDSMSRRGCDINTSRSYIMYCILQAILISNVAPPAYAEAEALQTEQHISTIDGWPVVMNIYVWKERKDQSV